MKRLLAYLLLALSFGFIFNTKADDISDFQIEGMSIGDSALDYYNKKEIKKFMKTYYPKSRKFYLLENDTSKFQAYENVQFAFKKKDKTYVIHGIAGAIFYENNIEECLKKFNEIKNDLNIIFKDTQIVEYGEKLVADGEARQLGQIQYIFNDGAVISCECTDWSEKMESKHGYTDNLSINLYSNEYAVFVRFEAYETY